MQTETNNKPFYKILFDRHANTLPIYPSDIEDGLNKSFSLCEYTALAVNNLAPLAEALQAFVDYLDSDLSEAETILLAQAKKALASIS